MRTRTTRAPVDRPLTPRQSYSRRDDPEMMGPRYNSPGRYRDYDYNSSRDMNNYGSSRGYNYRDYPGSRDYPPRDYQGHDYHRGYQNSKEYPRDYNSRDYNSRDYDNRPNYSNPSRDFNPMGRDYNSGSREFHGSRDYQSSRDYRDYPPSQRDYPASRDYPRYDYPQGSRAYPPGGRDVPDYDKGYQDRRYYRDRVGPYDRRNTPRQELRRPEPPDYGYDSKRMTGPLRRQSSTTTKIHRTKVFIGNLSGDVSQDDLTSKFSSFGPINRIDFRRKFAFVDYVRSKDAEAAIREMHNKVIWGTCLKVQPHIEQQKKLSSREPKPSFQITVTNLDQSVSWQDLKDFARQAGDVNYASIIIKGDKRFGLIEFTNAESVQNAMRDLNGQKIVANNLELIHVPVSEFLKKLGYNNENLVIEEPTGDAGQPHEFNAEADRPAPPARPARQTSADFRYNNDTFEAEDNSKSPSNLEAAQDDLYQEGNLDSVDYN